jgi:ABC-type multidrug transport system fused ATPase/permease subunit
LTFSYPTDTTTKPALQDCSFTILPGQLVVIVGGNGSGKSSLIKLLTRQYDPTAGELLIDGRPVHEYKLSDLREAIAVLAQDHELFEGLTICENVGLGRWQHMADHDLVQKALELGGAESVVHKFKDGANTVLMPTATKNCLNVITREDAKLKTLYEELEKNSDVSGGEKQRLIASVPGQSVILTQYSNHHTIVLVRSCA